MTTGEYIEWLRKRKGIKKQTDIANHIYLTQEDEKAGKVMGLSTYSSKYKANNFDDYNLQQIAGILKTTLEDLVTRGEGKYSGAAIQKDSSEHLIEILARISVLLLGVADIQSRLSGNPREVHVSRLQSLVEKEKRRIQNASK